MTILANILGIAAMAMFVFSYQLKTRRTLIFFNAGSRVLYVLQYILLGAFEGLVLDATAFLVSLLAQYKDRGWLKKHIKLVIVGSNIFIVAMGLICYQNIFSLLPIIGVLFETGALWPSNERHIRWLSLLGAPFWLAYNLLFAAYGSAAGNVLTIVSIGIAIVRYDILKKSPNNQ